MASTDVDLEETEVNNLKFPLWKHVTKFVPPKSSNARGGNTRFRCHFCENDYLGSYSRVRAHLLKIKNEGVVVCSKMTSPMLEQLRKEDREASEAAANAAPSHKLVRLPPFDDSNARSSKKGMLSNQLLQIVLMQKLNILLILTLQCYSTLQVRKILNDVFYFVFSMFVSMKWLYFAGLSFNVARNPNYRASYNYVANHDLGGYVPPGYNALRTTLLQKEKTHVDRMLMPIKSS
jgi:hypothetical protein